MLPTSPDDGEFEQICQSLPAGLVTVACGGGYFRPLQSFCFSLKAAAIRKGADAMHFDWDCSRANWDSIGGIQYFGDFIGLHRSRGVRLFFIDASPKSGSLTQRTAELVRSPMARGSIDPAIAEVIHREALSRNVAVIVTALAEVVATEQAHRALKDFDAAIAEKQGAVKRMRDGISELERQFQIPNAEAQIDALPKDDAEQMWEARDALPRLKLTMEEGEARIAKLGQLRKDLKKKKSPKQLLSFLKAAQFSGAWKGILLEQYRATDDWYSATVAVGSDVESFGPLYFMWKCPLPPVLPPRPESKAGLHQAPAATTLQRRGSWLRRLFG